MKNSILSLSLVLISQLFFAQNFRGRAIYESKTNMAGDVQMQGSGMSDAQIKMIEAQLKKAFEKTFVLDFDATKSTYTEEQKLAQAPTSGFQIRTLSSSSSGLLYKNIKAKESVNAVEGMDGKNYLVTTQLPQYDWQISSETKNIGIYKCIKATVIIKVTNQEKQEYAESIKKKNISSFITYEEPKDRTISAWFTMDIPVSTGPENYQGLPGLILEMNMDKTTLLCSKIIMNPKDATEIKRPSKGKTIDEKTYEKIMQKGMEQMMEQNEINRDGKNGKMIQSIRISR